MAPLLHRAAIIKRSVHVKTRHWYSRHGGYGRMNNDIISVPQLLQHCNIDVMAVDSVDMLTTSV